MTKDEATLIQAISLAIRKSRARCNEEQIVETLLSIAAGRAVESDVMTCHQFHLLAHDTYHSAEDMADERRKQPTVKGPTIVH